MNGLDLHLMQTIAGKAASSDQSAEVDGRGPLKEETLLLVVANNAQLLPSPVETLLERGLRFAGEDGQVWRVVTGY
jgi:hypothetical protein